MKRKNKSFYIVLIILILFSVSIGYAVINRTLSITGNSEVKKNTWDIHFENVLITPGSVESIENPTINNTNLSVNFNFMLNLPGDFYEFTVDVVNAGTIDAMLDSVIKTPELSDEQKKYIIYIIEYQNGEEIKLKQLVEKKKEVRLKVRVEYKKDIDENNLPTIVNNLNLGFTLNYVQADSNTAISVKDNGFPVFEIVSGTGSNIGDEICLDTECFYVISSSDTEITMLAKYSLLVGNRYDGISGAIPLENATGIQNESVIGWFSGSGKNNPMIGTIHFSDTNYWKSFENEYPLYIYNENSHLYSYVENYKKYLEKYKVTINQARLIKKEELDSLGCDILNKTCLYAPKWVYLDTYWTGTASSNERIFIVSIYNTYTDDVFNSDFRGLRPVIVVSKSYFE